MGLQEDPMAAILLTGRPGCGKATLIREVVRSLDVPAGGFYTEEVRAAGRRLGFDLAALDSGKPILGAVMLGPHPFADAVKARRDIEVLTLAQENRQEMGERVLR